jgi:hypothetical protein
MRPFCLSLLPKAVDEPIGLDAPDQPHVAIEVRPSFHWVLVFRSPGCS